MICGKSYNTVYDITKDYKLFHKPHPLSFEESCISTSFKTDGFYIEVSDVNIQQLCGQ